MYISFNNLLAWLQSNDVCLSVNVLANLFVKVLELPLQSGHTVISGLFLWNCPFSPLSLYRDILLIFVCSPLYTCPSFLICHIYISGIKVCRQRRKTFLLLYCLFFLTFYFFSFPLTAFCDFSAIFHRISLIFGQLVDYNLKKSCIHFGVRRSKVKVIRWH